MMWTANTAPATAYFNNDTGTNTTPTTWTVYERRAPDSDTAVPWAANIPDRTLYMVGYSAGAPPPRVRFDFGDAHAVFMAELRDLAGHLRAARTLTHRLHPVLLPSRARERRRRRGTTYVRR